VSERGKEKIKKVLEKVLINFHSVSGINSYYPFYFVLHVAKYKLMLLPSETEKNNRRQYAHLAKKKREAERKL
jgi:hypothetical protein